MKRTAGEFGRFLSSVAVLFLVAVVVPVGLSAASQSRFGSPNPLAGADPPWRWFGGGAASLARPLSDDTVTDGIIRLSLCVAWIAVLLIIVTTMVEVVHLVRHRGVPTPNIRGFGWAQRIARFIAAGIVVLVPISSPAVSVASTMSSISAPTEQPSPASVPANPTNDGPTLAVDDATPAATHMTHIVQPGESVYSIAERLAARTGGDVIEFAGAILDANLGRPVGANQRFTNPAYIEVGWALRIPVGLAAPATPGRTDATGATAAPAVPATTAPADPAPDIHIVEPGDTLWDIAETELGDPNEWTDIWDDNAGRDMGGGQRFVDPDLILPGWELHLPADPIGNDQDDDRATPTPVIDAAPPAPTDAGDDSIRSDQEPITETPAAGGPPAAEPAPPSTAVTAPAATPDTVPSSAGPSITATPAATTTTGTPSTTTIATPISGDAGSSINDANSTPDPQAPIRLEHAALLAAGILALVGVRRRQRLRAAAPRHRVPEPRAEVVESERRLRAIDAGERAQRIDVSCRAAAAALIGTGVQIGWVAAAPDGNVALRLTAPAELPAPWSGHRQDWHLGADIPIELLAEDARRVGLPCIALFQLGVTTEGADLLVDLEACGTLVIAAPREYGNAVISAVTAGLASSLYAETAHLIGVSVPPSALLEHRNAHEARDLDDALTVARSLVGTTRDQERSTFELRSLHTGGDAWEPAVILLGDGGGPLDDVTLPEPGSGIALVSMVEVGDPAPDLTRLVADPTGWHLDGFGGTVGLTPVGLTPADLGMIDALLADAERPLIDTIQWMDTSAVVDDLPTADTANRAVDPTAEHVADGTTAEYVDVEHDVVVRLLGSVMVADTAGATGRFERSKTVELIAWLATHRTRATRSGARAALWELDVRDATFANVVSEARRGLARLVPPPEGEEWVGRTLSDQLPLHRLVVADADLVEARLEHARLQPPRQALDTLRPAVEMICDLPFAGTSYLWPDAEGITSNLVLLAITAASDYAAHALSLGDTDGVFWATGRGLRVLSGHEEMIGLRMRAHARAGDLAGVRQEWESYERVLVADAWSDGEPAPKLLALRRELLSPS